MLNVIYALFFRELKTRFGANRHLGYLWVVGEPMSVVLIVAILGTIIREYHHEVMPEGISIFMFLVLGIIPFFMFRSIVTQLMNGIGANLALFAYKPVKPIHVFIARTLLEFCIYFVIFITVLFGAGWFFRLDVIPVHFLNVAFCILLLMFSGFALGVVFAIIWHFVEPLRTLLAYFSILFYWSSGIIFPTWLMPKPLLDIFYYNPLLHIMENLRYNFFENYPVKDDYTYTYPIFCIMVTLFIALFLYYYNRQALTAVIKA
ncbi:ABC transporter permease [Campylobacter jejuni]|uniref:capsule polysaccharide transporter KpsM n=1 Tax=Campylobacter jejuni TaxID=197 RepID=UPI000893A2BD|nr:ABC transporter permease [Campylobacter jejuni]EAH4890873.1 ABC transporter permease [Campylobacter jejuni]EAH6699820.1 ABC transporter permease [Campylobacter jejuni]EAH9262242.1 ABC transporter permease [Campylobacter jejuni]EAI3304705.1 ABC transporter permease [Campylobacter jejuni]EAI3993604.1 ABC transporter permease [Campylobacter jejuni]